MSRACHCLVLAVCLAPGTAAPGGERPGDEAKVPRAAEPYGGRLPPGAVARLGTPRFVHDQWVYSLAFSPDGKILASGTYEYLTPDTTIHLWDMGTGKELRRLTGHRRSIVFVCF